VIEPHPLAQGIGLRLLQPAFDVFTKVSLRVGRLQAFGKFAGLNGLSRSVKRAAQRVCPR
jgi:hypothetical protein